MTPMEWNFGMGGQNLFASDYVTPSFISLLQVLVAFMTLGLLDAL